MTPSDPELMARIRERDPDAFEALFARYQEGVRRHLARVVRDAAAADDLVQEVFLRVWTHAGQWHGQGSFKAWLFRIAINLALNHLRSVHRRREQSLDVPSDAMSEMDEGMATDWLIDASALDPEAALEQTERHALLQRLIEDLPDEKRRVVRLIEEERDLQEIAEALGIPEGTVKSRLHYARKRLARAWKEIETEWQRF